MQECENYSLIFYMKQNGFADKKEFKFNCCFNAVFGNGPGATRRTIELVVGMKDNNLH
jgi:hypothetical protein